MDLKNDTVAYLINLFAWVTIGVATLLIFIFMFDHDYPSYTNLPALGIYIGVLIGTLFIFGFTRIIDLLNQINQKLDRNVWISTINEVKENGKSD